MLKENDNREEQEYTDVLLETEDGRVELIPVDETTELIIEEEAIEEVIEEALVEEPAIKESEESYEDEP